MRKLLLTVLLSLFCLSPVYASTMSAHNEGGETLLLQDTPCTNDTILTQLQKEVPDVANQFQAGSYINAEGVKTPTCWYLAPSMNVVVLHEDGGIGVVPAVAFRPEGI